MLLRYFLLSLLFFLVAAQNVTGQSVRTHVNTDSVSVGDVFQYSLILQLDAEYNKIQYPDTVLFPPAVELTSRQQFRLSSFSDSTTYHLQFFGTEDVRIRPLPVHLISENDTTTLYTEPVTLFFKPLVAEGDTTLKPMKPNFAFPRPWWPWILAALAIAAFLVWWFKFKKEPEPKPAKPQPKYVPFQDPLVELENTLQTIRTEHDISETRDFKSYYSSISDAIRKYFEDLYLIPALESTTRELVRYLDAYGADDEMNALTRRILNKADLVKFAKFTPTLDDAQSTYQLAIDFVDRARVADSTRISRMREKYEEQFLNEHAMEDAK